MEVTKFIDNSDSSDYERDVLYSFVSNLSAISKDSTEISKYFILFIACDFSKYSIDELSDFAEKMLDSGVACVCTFGTDCGKMHDIFDDIIVYREVIEKKEFPHILTTWHENDTLDEALWFGLFSAFVDDDYIKECKSTLIVAVEDEEWNKHLLSKLSNIRNFHQETLETISQEIENENNERRTINN